MKTKVTSDSSTESVPSQTTAVTTSAGQSSVWSICDISTDTHVELRDITPSISPVFTDDQVHELTRTSSEVDVLGEHFLPPGTFKRIDEVLSSDGQSNLLYSDPVLRSALKSSNHDVLLPEELSFHGSMFPSFDSIVEADRILNKRDEQADVIHSEVDGDLESTDLSKKSGSSVNNASNKAADDDGNTSGTDSKLRRSPRKRVQAKKDSDVLKSAPLAQKSISRGKDISKLKYANTEEEAPRKEVRRSGRGQKKIVKEDTDTDKKEKESAGNTKKKNKKGDITDDESSGKQDSLSKNVRRSPRNQSKAQEEDKKKATSKKEEKAEKTNSSCTENKEAPSGNETSKSKTQEQANKNKASENKSDVEEKKGIRKSGRITRNKENQQKEEDEEKTVDESSDGNEKQSKGKAEGKKAKTAKVKIEEESVKDESSEKLKVKIGNKNDTENELVKQEVELNDSDSKAVGRRKVDSIKKEASYGEEMVKTRRGKSANKGKKEKENDADNKSDRESEEKLKESTKIEDPAIEVKEDKVVSDKEDHRPVEGSTKKVDAEGIKSKIKQEDISENLSPTKENLKDEKLGQTNDEPQDESSDEPEEEEYNEDSDYDPEYDPDRLWCVCRKPHGNKFMICCDHCEEWFHGICVGITMAQGRQMERNGQEYTCPKCKAKIEEEKKKGKPLTDPPVKENDESAGSTEQGEKSPSKRYHPSRKDHSLKIKLPSPEKRKRRLRQSRDEIFEDVSSKRRKESDKHLSEHIKEAKTSKAPESQGFRIPKKVRTTPTPALHSHPPTRQKCIRTGCSMLAEHYSLYCSHECIHRYAEESVNVILEEKRKRSGCKSSVSSSKNVTSPSPTVLGSSHWDSQQPTGSSHSESSQLREGIAVIERSTGRVIAGVAAPSQEELVHWLQDHPSFEVLCPTVKDDRKKEKKEDSEKTVRESIRKSLKDILTTRSKDQPDVNVSGEEIDKCSLNVEGEMYSFFGDTGHRYKNKYRSLMFNLKDPRNKVLFRHVLSGEITVDRLVRMTPEQLASPELATWREQETKHTLEMIKMNQEEINATKAHIKKTHKGEVEIDDDDLSSLENSVKTNAELKVEKDLPDSNTSPNILFLDTTDEHRIHLFDLNCRICTGKMAPPGEPPRRETPSPLVSTTSIVQAVAESSMPSPTPMEISTSANSPDSATVSQRPVSPSVLSKTQKKVPAVWKGFVMMQSVAKFGTSAYRVSGSCDDLLHLLPDTLHVQGRIAHDQVWDYLTQLKSSTSREVCVIRYEASSDDEKLSYVSLYSYFYSRKRCGVVSNCYTGVKDMYLVPLASHQAIPPELLPFDGPGLDEPRPHMLLGVIVRSKALFKRPRALSQRSLSPPPKRRTSSASAETNSSDGGTGDSPSRKSGDTSFSELRDSPPADIDDIVFQYNTTQAKMASKVGKESPVKASPLSETIASPTSSKDSSSVPSLEAQKQQLLDLQERARQYILAQTQRKQTASEELQGQSLKITDSSDATNEGNEEGKGGGDGDDDDAPYDPEEGLNLDLDVTDPTSTKPVVAAQPEEPPKPSSLEMLVSTLQKLQGGAPNLSALTSLLPKVSTTTSGGPAGRSLLTSETKSATAISSLGGGAHLGKPLTTEPGTSALASGILQPVAAVSSLLQPVTSSSSTSQATVSTGHRSHQAVSGTRGSQLSPISAQRLRLSSQRLQQQEVERPQAGSSLDNRAHIRPSPGQHYGDHRSRYGGTSDYIQKPGSSSAQGNQADPSEISFANRWNPSEPPQVNRQVNTASQEIAQYSGLRPEERARLAAHESRLESRENTRSSEHREENYDQRRSNDRQRSNWHNDSRFPRDSRNSRDDSRRPFREEYRHGRPWCGDEQRRDRFEHDRSRQNDRGRERRFKEHWSRDRWRR